MNYFGTLQDLIFRLVPPMYITITPLRAFLFVTLLGWGVWEWAQWRKYR